ncbi:MAG TPA: hypothetical protein VK808_01435 [Bacteroidia bacterium]|nr:hypothetical protein [Bacteroidia bacterium]
MKHKSLYKQLTYLAYSSSFIVVLAGCAKEDTTKVETTTNTTSQTTIASDELTLNNEFDQAADEAIAVICNPKISIPGASIDTSQLNIGVITIYYSGKEADGTKSRTGSDSIHENMVSGKVVPWGTPGTTASMTLGCVNSPGYEIQFLNENNISVRLNGTAKLTNLKGGYFQNISSTDSLTAVIRGSLNYTFNDNLATITYYPLNVNQVRLFTQPAATRYASTSGDTVISSFKNISGWGTDRFGNTYYTSINTTVVQNISDYTLSYNPLSGVKDIQNIEEPILCTYGVDQQGNVITSGTPYGFYISWFNNGGGAQAIVPYYY